jgi:hypothetical protein
MGDFSIADWRLAIQISDFRFQISDCVWLMVVVLPRVVVSFRPLGLWTLDLLLSLRSIGNLQYLHLHPHDFFVSADHFISDL